MAGLDFRRGLREQIPREAWHQDTNAPLLKGFISSFYRARLATTDSVANRGRNAGLAFNDGEWPRLARS